MTTGMIVANARKRLGITQAELAENIGVSRNTVSRIENDEYANMTAHTALNLARALGVSLDYLLCLKL